MSAAMLEVENLKAWYGAAQILFELSFHVGRGEVVALMGRNGAGKSTTFKALMALIPQRSGTVRFLGENISQLKPFEIARRGLGFVPEDRRIFSDLTVAENLDIGAMLPMSGAVPVVIKSLIFPAAARGQRPSDVPGPIPKTISMA